MGITAVLFDLDGVLVDTLHYHYLAWLKKFNELGGSVSEHTVLLHEGRASHEILPILMEEAGVTIPAGERETFILEKRAYYREIVKVSFYPGALDTVKTLQKRGIRTAIVTACSKATMHSSLTEEERALFDFIQTGDDIDNAKPDPEPYDKARKRFGVAPAACAVIENAPLGIESAKNAGLYCVGVSSTLEREYLQQADVVVGNIRDVVELDVFT